MLHFMAPGQRGGDKKQRLYLHALFCCQCGDAMTAVSDICMYSIQGVQYIWCTVYRVCTVHYYGIYGIMCGRISLQMTEHGISFIGCCLRFVFAMYIKCLLVSRLLCIPEFFPLFLGIQWISSSLLVVEVRRCLLRRDK